MTPIPDRTIATVILNYIEKTAYSLSKNEVYVTTRNGVMAHFTLIHYMPV